MSVTAEQRQRYEAWVESMIEVQRPGLFAALREVGECEDAEVVGWGMAWPDHVEVVSRGGSRLRSASTERVLWFLRRGEDCSIRLVWLTPQPDDSASADD